MMSANEFPSPASAEIDRLFADFADEHRPPGCGLAVVCSGKLLRSWTRGVASIASGRAVEQDSVFRIASMTKSFAAAAILRLRDSGRLSLDNSPLRFIPELQPRDHFEQVTIRDLLSMQGGLPTDDPWADWKLQLDDAEISSLLCQPVFPVAFPGTEHHYSNLGYFLLGRIITRAAEEHALSFVRNSFLEPLGLRETVWGHERDCGERCLTGYSRSFAGGFREMRLPSGLSDAAVFGGLSSTLQDLARWIEFLSAPPSSSQANAVLSHRSRQELQHGNVLVPMSRIPAALPPAATVYAFGLRRILVGDCWTVGHSGGLPGSSSHMQWSPEHGIGVIGFTNLSYAPVWNLCRRTLTQLLSETSRQHRPTAPILQQRFEALLNLAASYSTSAAQQVLSENMFADYQPSELVELVRSLAGPDSAPLQLEAVAGLSAEIRRNGVPVALLSLAPAEGSKVQQILLYQQPL